MSDAFLADNVDTTLGRLYLRWMARSVSQPSWRDVCLR